MAENQNALSRSVLDSVKHICGVEPSMTHFDDPILLHLNGVIFTTKQIGLDPIITTRITDSSTTWEQLYGPDCDVFVVENYIGLKVKELFDPPTNSSTMEALRRNIDQYEWRINVAQPKESE